MKFFHSEYFGIHGVARIFFIGLLLVSTMGLQSCKSKKKILAEKQAAEATAAHKAKIEKTKVFLRALLNNDGGKSLEQREREFASIKNQKWEDPEVLALIEKVDRKLKEERALVDAAKAKAEAEAREREKEKEAEVKNSQTTVEERLMTSFGVISTTSSLSTANSNIEQTLTMFASRNVPVLIVINENRNDVDYDKPTTISKYLHFLKDQKKPADKIKEVSFNNAGKITELILTKE